MSNPNPNCPSRQVLAAYLRNKLTPAQSEVVKEHVTACPTCAGTVRHFLEFAKKQTNTDVPLRRLDGDNSKWLYAGIGFLAAVAIGAGVWFLQRSPAPPTDEPAPTPVVVDMPPEATATPSAPGNAEPVTTPSPTAVPSAVTPTASPAAPAPTPIPSPTIAPLPLSTPTPSAVPTVVPPEPTPTAAPIPSPPAAPTPSAAATPTPPMPAPPTPSVPADIPMVIPPSAPLPTATPVPTAVPSPTPTASATPTVAP